MTLRRRFRIPGRSQSGRALALRRFVFRAVISLVTGIPAILFAAWIKGLHGLGFAFSCISGIVIVAAFLGLAAYRSLPGDMARLQRQVPESAGARA